MSEWMQYTLYGNTILSYILVLVTIIVGMAILLGIKRMALGILSRRMTGAENAQRLHSWQKLINRVLFPVCIILLIFLSLRVLHLNDQVLTALNILFWAAVASSMGSGLSQVIVSLFTKYSFTETGDQDKSNAIHWMTVFLKIIIWSMALVFFLDNMDVQIKSLITFLGVGGIIIAFSAQTILADIFCFVTIFLDKPFEIGDFIAVGPIEGTVERIGLKTTRIRSLNGEQIVIANTDITGSRLQNYKTLAERRVIFPLGVVYETPYRKLEKIPALMEEIIGSVPGATFGRTHFTAYRDYSLEFEVVYFIQGSDYVEYLDIHHQVNLKIAEVFQRESIAFAFPTRDVRVSGTLSGVLGMEGKQGDKPQGRMG